MRQEAQLAGLRASTPDLRLRMRDLGGLPRKQLKGKWRVLQLFFFNRPKRQVRADQKIHSSVLFKSSEYKPKASVPSDFELSTELLVWGDKESLSKVTKLNEHWEKGLFDSSITRDMLDDLSKGNQLEYVHYIAFLVQSSELKILNITHYYC